MKLPKEMAQIMIDTSIHKTNRSFIKTIILAIMSGMFIAFGSFGNIIAGSSIIKTNPSLAKLLGACVFPVGLMLIVIFGADLFTSSVLNIIPTISKKVKILNLAKNITLVFIFNFVGAIIIAGITYSMKSLSSGSNFSYLKLIVEHKVMQTPGQILLSGILCNILVCGAVILSYSSEKISGKILCIWFPIMIFILLGYDHSVANMYYLSIAYYTKAETNILLLAKNLGMATIGNIIGGLFVGGGFYIAQSKIKLSKRSIKNIFKKKNDKNNNEK